MSTGPPRSRPRIFTRRLAKLPGRPVRLRQPFSDLQAGVCGRGEAIKLVGRCVDAVEAELFAELQRKILQSLEVVIQGSAALIDEHPCSIVKPP